MQTRASDVRTLRYLVMAGVVFLAVVMALGPDVGFAAPPAASLLFWTTQIGIGVGVVHVVLSRLLRQLGNTRVPLWALVVLSGVLGAVVLTPLYWTMGEVVMQQWLAFPATPADGGDDFQGATLGVALLLEYADIVGPVTSAWALICLPRLHWFVPPVLQVRTAGGAVVDEMTAPHVPTALAVAVGAGAGPVPNVGDRNDTGADNSAIAGAPSDRSDGDPRSSTASRPRWAERLPVELGQDIIAVASELQYLRVWTTRGNALILGALADVETAAADDGVRVLRSWWVATKHIVSVRRTAGGALCVMSDGRRVPVSRRRRADVLARFGDGARYVAPASSKADAKSNLQ